MSQRETFDVVILGSGQGGKRLAWHCRIEQVTFVEVKYLRWATRQPGGSEIRLVVPGPPLPSHPVLPAISAWQPTA